MPATGRSLQAPHIYRSRGSHRSLRFNNLLEQLTELERALYLLLQFYYKRYKSEPTKWNRHTVGGLGGFLMQSFLASPHGVRGLTLPAYLWVHQQGSSSEPQHPELYWSFITKAGLIKSLAMLPSSISSPLLLPKCQHSNPMFDLSGDQPQS